MIRVVVAVLASIALAPTAIGQSNTLGIDTARAIVARSGVNVGTVFADGPRRFVIASVNSRSTRPNVFEITVTVRPVGQ